MTRIRIPSELKKMSAVFASKGFSSYLVGGAVRDMFLGKRASDWDIATDAPPQEVSALFPRVIPTGIEHGTVTVIFMGHHVEVTTFRTDKGYSDGRHPDNVTYAATIEEDLSRRDFTMNAIALSLPDGNICDPFGGRADIKRRIIRTVGDPRERFSEDGLRPVRALRFSAQLGFEIEAETLAAIPGALDVTAKIAVERFRDEFTRILGCPVPSAALRLMDETGIMPLFIPELSACRGVEQRGFHRFDVFDHLLFSCDGAPRENLTVRLAALFHDIGKPAVRAEKTGAGEKEPVYTFYGHETVSARMTEEILDRLRYPKQAVRETVHLIACHMFHYEDSWTDAAVRRFLVRVTPEAMNDLFSLRRADIYGMNRIPAPPD